MDIEGGAPPAEGVGPGASGTASYEDQVAEVVNRAINAGVQPLTEGGEDLITLAPEQLSQWVATYLEPKLAW